MEKKIDTETAKALKSQKRRFKKIVKDLEKDSSPGKTKGLPGAYLVGYHEALEDVEVLLGKL